MDEFFSSIEGQRLTSKLEEREINAKKKIETARQDQQKRLGGLQDVQELNERKASTLQVNADRVQETMDAVNGLIAQGKDWVEIGQLIELEQKRNNPVAAIIKLPLKLEENTITLLLDEEDIAEDDDSAYETESEASDSEDEAPKVEGKVKTVEKRLTIDIDLALSPWANAREYFDQRRSAADKEQKTLQSSTKALKSQEAKIAQDLKKGLNKEKAVLRPVRRQLWVEKFIWFISSVSSLLIIVLTWLSLTSAGWISCTCWQRYSTERNPLQVIFEERRYLCARRLTRCCNSGDSQQPENTRCSNPSIDAATSRSSCGLLFDGLGCKGWNERLVGQC